MKQIYRKSVMNMVKSLTLLSFMASPVNMWGADDDLFTEDTPEGVSVQFKVISESEKTCQVGTGSYWGAVAIDQSTEGAITIPETVNGYRVTAIGEGAFYSCAQITSVKIPNSVLKIGGFTFANCSKLADVTMSENVEMIEGEAFTDTPWYENLPEGLIYMGKLVYKYKGDMPADTEITIKEGTKAIAAGAFFSCENMTAIHLNDDLEVIGNQSFTYCRGLSEIKLPENLKSIEYGAFRSCSNLKSISISKNVSNIGETAFESCTGLESITIDAENPYYESTEEQNGIIEKEWKTLIVAVGMSVIPDGVKAIGSGVFSGYRGETVSIPESVEVILEGAFSNSYVRYLTLPNGLKSIGSNVFAWCKRLETITLPSTLERIGNYSFNGCTNLTAIYSYIEEPFALNEKVINTPEIFSNATLYVPVGTRDKYLAKSAWNQFETIKEMEPTGIAAATHIESASNYYDASGRERSSLQKGLNIIRLGDGSVRKVIVR